MEERAQDLPAVLINPAPVLLRPVNTLSQEYLDMLADFRLDGHFGNSILVRPLSGGRYEVVDGMYRWTAGHEAGLEVFQCIVRDMDDEEVLIWQIKLNATRRDTDPIEYARHLKRLIDLKGQDMTQVQLAELTGRSRSWINEMLKLNDLLEPYQKMVQRGQLTIGNAQLLAKLRAHLQPDYADAAQIQTLTQFRRTVADAVNKYREDIRAGRIEAFWSSQIKPYMRRMEEIHHELETWETGAKMIVKHACVSPLDGWKLAVQWLMKMDPEELEYRRNKLQRAELERLDELKRLDDLREGRKQMLDSTDDPEYDD